MRILYADADHEHARWLHSEILSYKGLNWDLQHCENLGEVGQSLERERFDLVLLAAGEDDAANGAWEEFIRRPHDLPIVILHEGSDRRKHERLVRLGANDCLQKAAVNGAFLMRRLRMAVSRFHNAQQALPGAIRQYELHPQTSPATPSPIASQEGVATAGSHVSAALVDDTARPLSRLLFVKDRTSPNSLDQEVGQYFSVETVLELAAARERISLSENRLQAVVVEQGVVENEGLKQLCELLPTSLTTPLILLMLDRSDATAVSFMEHGVDECLVASTANAALLEHAVHLARARVDHWQAKVQNAATAPADVADRRSTLRSGRDRRLASRYLITRPLIAIPVRPNGAPDKDGAREAFTIDVSTGGIGFQIATSQVLPSRNWVLGVESANDHGHDFHYAHTFLKNVSYTSGGIRLGTQFQHADVDLFRESNLLPKLESDSQRMRCGLAEDVLAQWVKVGVLQHHLLDRIKVCPKCGGTAAVGDGCQECGTADIEFRELIHHFACAYVGDATEFRSEQGLMCPKCLTRNLVAGADFEVIKTEYRCRRCEFDGNELETVGTCLHCRLKFPLRMAHEEEVFGYHVDRLDILAFLSATT